MSDFINTPVPAAQALSIFLNTARQLRRLDRVKRFDDAIMLRIEGEEGAAFLDEFEASDEIALAQIVNLLKRHFEARDKLIRSYLHSAHGFLPDQLTAFLADRFGTDENPPKQLDEDAPASEAEMAIFEEAPDRAASEGGKPAVRECGQSEICAPSRAGAPAARPAQPGSREDLSGKSS